MKYIEMVCGRCDLKFGIADVHHNYHDSYNCPLCGSDKIATIEDLKPGKKTGRPRKVPPYVFNRTIIKEG